MKWIDVIDTSEEYIDLLMQKMHSMDPLDCKYKQMWREKLAIALCKHQEVLALAGVTSSKYYSNMEQAK
jgi:hypothetical protein